MAPGITDQVMALENPGSCFLQAAREGVSQYLVYSKCPSVVKMLDIFIKCCWIV